MTKPNIVSAKLPALAGLALFTMATVAYADAFDKLQGYWAGQALQCNTVFNKTNGQIRFNKVAGHKRRGLIIKKDRVEGQNGSCRITSHKDLADGIAVGLNCQLEIMFDTIVVRVRLKNDDELVQFDPDLPDLTTTYKRCSM